MKKLFVILAILFIGILVAGCTSTPPAPVVTPATTAAPTTAVPTYVQNQQGVAIIKTVNVTATPTLAPPMKTIVETAVADGRFTTLVAAVQAAKLDGALSGPGPFTVFAPTDDAFKKLPAGTVETLLKTPEGQLKQILLYHVVDGKVMAADVVKLSSAKTLQGSNVNITVAGGVVKINDATVIITDIQTKNGVIHVIDKVLLPPK
jgi:transforming growth factor-beta-induced protein